MYGLISDEYFIDIGIPQDYNKSQQELPSLI
jgi:D-glycero-alpha-D-manno-heptose 1-phosphate guanylyltransferase